MAKRSIFKQIIRNDANSVFLNQQEFGELHNVDGRTMTIISDMFEQLERRKTVSESIDGIYENTDLIYVRADEYGRLPAPGKVLNLDGRPFRIVDATDEDGIYSIEIKAVKS